MDEDDLWQRERAFWLEGEGFYRRALDPEALMLFPGPVGMMSGEAAIDALSGAPRWQQVDMSERHVLTLSDASVALVYRASASRSDGEAYEALCSSVYRTSGNDWLLCLHQQTVIA